MLQSLKPADTLRVACPCGQVIAFPVTLSGRVFRCPRCGRAVADGEDGLPECEGAGVLGDGERVPFARAVVPAEPARPPAAVIPPPTEIRHELGMPAATADAIGYASPGIAAEHPCGFRPRPFLCVLAALYALGLGAVHVLVLWASGVLLAIGGSHGPMPLWLVLPLMLTLIACAAMFVGSFGLIAQEGRGLRRVLRIGAATDLCITGWQLAMTFREAVVSPDGIGLVLAVLMTRALFDIALLKATVPLPVYDPGWE